MYLEYTEKLSGEPFADLREALLERKDLLLNENLNSQQQQSIDRLLGDKILLASDYLFLTELAARTQKLWDPGEDIPIFFFSGSNVERQKVFDYASEWANYGNFTFSITTDVDAAKLRVDFQRTGHWSYIGTDAKGVSKTKQTINFDLRYLISETEYKRVVLHEFGHALGMEHEHQSPEADMQWDKAYIYQQFDMLYGWSKAKVDHNIFAEFDKTTIRYSQLDPLSIMGYYLPPDYTMNRISFPLNFELSATDKSYIATLYPRLLHS